VRRVRELLVATTNAGKLREIRSLLDGLSLDLKTLADFPGIPIADETGSSFGEIARQKALHYARLTGMVAMGEDSGFEVNALNGEPGIYSARYLREEASYEERFADLDRRVREAGARDRRARFVCALAVAKDEQVVFETRGVVEGELAERAAGANGFGYDPIFLYPPYGRTFGEVSEAEKTAVSHRGQAMHEFRRYVAEGLHPARLWPA
jgi:XTP/dITP diphosphohydrolase